MTRETGAARPDFDGMSDSALLRHAISQVSFPAKELESFALHMPFELLARHSLLEHVDPAARGLVRRQLVAAADLYRRTVEPHPVRPPVELDFAHDFAPLLGAIANADVSETAALVSGLVTRVSAAELSRELTPVTLDSLSAAGHAPIFFQRLAALDDAVAGDARRLLIALVPELARMPKLRFSWDPKPQSRIDAPRSSAELADSAQAALSSVVAPEARPVSSIFGIVYAAESAGVPESVLGPTLQADWSLPEVADALGRASCRVAVLSMLVEDTTHAKYGWTHALTLAHANWVLAKRGADARRCTRNALVFAAACRYSMAHRPLPERLELPRVADPFAVALESDPMAAAARAYHATPDEADDIWQSLATAAATRNDAHLVKHTLSALEMSREDPAEAALYRAAAARLVAIWIVDQPTEAIDDTLDDRRLER